MPTTRPQRVPVVRYEKSRASAAGRNGGEEDSCEREAAQKVFWHMETSGAQREAPWGL